MDAPQIDPADARAALAEVQTRRTQALGARLVPTWYWTAIGLLVLGFVAAIESRTPWLVVAGSVLYAVGLTAVVVTVARRAPFQARQDLLGRRGVLAIVGFALAAVVVALAAALLAVQAGSRWPGTWACVPVVALLGLGGPALMRHLGRLMLSRPLAGS